MSARAVTITVYLSIVGLAVVLQLAALRWPRRIPPLGTVFSRIMRTRVGGVGVMLAWAWIGLHFFVR